ncbi:uncharacterized protein LOC129891614 [Solanum dulcamara]|uniref:uncharacterized protein LOC129891614 n=1 Tax=Solanum dulcamara TaxID=45834 RepID=UPI002485B5A1|nr:uncharacterized protein LOC129891614 [Solanum dulcamara]
MQEQWEKCNAFVLAWIMNNVWKELLTGTVYATDAAMVWADLKEMFDKNLCGSFSMFEVVSFLMGLNEVYGNARSQILRINPLPSIGKAYAMIMAHEGQRMTARSHIGGGILESTALYAGKENYPKKYQFKKKNWDQICYYCKLQGHIKEDCYRLIGDPPD